jgi:hypothetical protein
MLPPARHDSQPEPSVYYLAHEEGLWQLSKPRGSKGKLVKVDSYRNFQEARAGAIKRAQRDPNGASLTISTVINFRRRREKFEFPPPR